MKFQPPTESKKSAKNKERLDDAARTSVALSNSEVISRYGSANAERVIGLTGTDQVTGQRLSKGLLDIAKHKVNADPLEAAKNIKQQAGFSAEVATTSRDNAEAIIKGSKIRTSRSDDLPQFGKNHNVVDRVQLLDGQVIEGSQSQMKFVGNRDELLNKIAKEDGKFARYRGVKLELPSEQFEGAAEHCQKQAEQLRFNASQAEQAGKPAVAERLRNEADNYDELALNVRDSGLTTEQAIFYRTHPRIATAVDIARTSHRAGVKGAQYGAAIGGTISLVRNIFSMAQGEVNASVAAKTLATDTAKASAMGYATAAAGSAIKGTLQQSSSQTLRALSQTSAPALVVNICISLGASISRYAKGEISESQLLAEVGEKGAGMLSGAMMAALGQLAIPVPFVGAAIGGMIGCTLSSLFYQSALNSARDVELSRDNLKRCRAIQKEARASIAEEQAALDKFLQREIPELVKETKELFILLDDESSDINAFTRAINEYAKLLGAQLQFNSLSDFRSFMDSDQPLRI
ncbi:MAG: hypothetical protein EKK45_03275 [Curvibacter sp.]|nr:MAG: hypothetical protein EKK45_03275 [Curvibacter sp.]